MAEELTLENLLQDGVGSHKISKPSQENNQKNKILSKKIKVFFKIIVLDNLKM